MANPVFYPDEVSDDYFTVLPWYYKFSFEATDGASGTRVAPSSVVENADLDKLGEKALIPEDDESGKPPSGPVGVLASDEDSASDEAAENSTEPVKKLLIRTFTDLHPKVALELSNITMVILESTDVDEIKKKDEGRWSL